MDILENLKTRRSIRKFTAEKVPEELLSRVVEAGLYAPTGMGRQASIILKITDPSTVRALGLVNGKIMTGKEDVDAFYGAPAVLCVLAPKDDPTASFSTSRMALRRQRHPGKTAVSLPLIDWSHPIVITETFTRSAIPAFRVFSFEILVICSATSSVSSPSRRLALPASTSFIAVSQAGGTVVAFGTAPFA